MNVSSGEGGRIPNPGTVHLAAIVFDFDGVIANTEPLHEDAYRAVLADFGVAMTHERYYAGYLGLDDRAVFAAVSREFDLNLDASAIDALIGRKTLYFQSRIDEATVLFAGARTSIERCAAAAPLAIASGALRAEIEMILDRTGLRRYFKAIVGAQDTLRSKPAPDPYLRALALLDAAAADAVAIEDSRWGIESARRAGLGVAAVTHTYPPHELAAADLIVRSLEEIDPIHLGAIIRQRARTQGRG